MITAIIGLPRVGKTSLKTHFACEYMTTHAQETMLKAKAIIKQMNKTGFNLSLPKKHLVYADYAITAKVDGRKPCISYHINPFELGLPNKHCNTAFLPPYSKLFLDELQRALNSREHKSLPDWVSRFFELHGHNFLDIFFTCQRYGLIDKNVRDIVGRFIEVQELKHKYDTYGNIIQSTWRCIEFENIFELEHYMNCGKKHGLGTKTTYTHRGNIFNCYNSQNFFPFFYRDKYNLDFDREPCLPTGRSLQSIKMFNAQNDFDRNSAFLKGSIK